jgi:transcriptional regulator with XRE-family HTH domain
VPHAEDVAEEDLRAEARGMLARAGISQRQLAERLGVSKAAVSRMLTDRAAGLSLIEAFHIEVICGVKRGTLARQAGLISEPSLVEQVYAIPGIRTQTAETIAAAIGAAIANTLRKESQP